MRKFEEENRMSRVRRYSLKEIVEALAVTKLVKLELISSQENFVSLLPLIGQRE